VRRRDREQRGAVLACRRPCAWPTGLRLPDYLGEAGLRAMLFREEPYKLLGGLRTDVAGCGSLRLLPPSGEGEGVRFVDRPDGGISGEGADEVRGGLD